jgi:hypothetical protein
VNLPTWNESHFDEPCSNKQYSILCNETFIRVQFIIRFLRTQNQMLNWNFNSICIVTYRCNNYEIKHQLPHTRHSSELQPFHCFWNHGIMKPEIGNISIILKHVIQRYNRAARPLWITVPCIDWITFSRCLQVTTYATHFSQCKRAFSIILILNIRSNIPSSIVHSSNHRLNTHLVVTYK